MDDKLAKVLETMRTELRLSPSDVEPLSVTAWNSHYRMKLDGQPQHLVIYTLPDPNAINGLLFEHRLLRHLQGARVRYIPKLVVVNRESLFPFAGGWFAVTEWIEGCRQEDDPPLTSGQVRAMAQGLAELHRAMAEIEMAPLDFHPDHVFVYPAHTFLDQHATLIERLKERLASEAFDDAARKGWSESRYRVTRFLETFPLDLYWEAVNENPTRIVHGDFRGMNAAFDGERLTHILDFNCCFNESRLWDVAYTALGLGGKETIGDLSDTDGPARFLKEYDAASTLTRKERELLPAMLTFVPAKLMVGAVTGWWITDRVQMIEDLIEGAAEEMVAKAGLA